MLCLDTSCTAGLCLPGSCHVGRVHSQKHLLTRVWMLGHHNQVHTLCLALFEREGWAVCAMHGAQGGGRRRQRERSGKVVAQGVGVGEFVSTVVAQHMCCILHTTYIKTVGWHACKHYRLSWLAGPTGILPLQFSEPSSLVLDPGKHRRQTGLLLGTPNMVSPVLNHPTGQGLASRKEESSDGSQGTGASCEYTPCPLGTLQSSTESCKSPRPGS